MKKFSIGVEAFPTEENQLAQGENLGIDRYREEIKEETRKYIEELLHNQKHSIGKGMTAEAHMHDKNPNLCFKILSLREAFGRNVPPPEIPITLSPDANYAQRQFHNAKQEGMFLLSLLNFDADVRVPIPEAHGFYENEDEGDGYYVKERLEVLAMERIHGVSLRDVLEKKAQLPETFVGADEFFRMLRNFMKRIHSEKHIFHRDLHGGNIMIDEITGKPVVIDFGRSIVGYSGSENDEDIYEFDHIENGRTIKGRHPNDDKILDDVEKTFRDFLS